MDPEQPMYEVIVSADGGTLWVNGADGSSIGRFSKRFGIDVHNTASDQLAGLPQCLACTHSSAGLQDWDVFRAQMRQHHGVELDERLLSFEAPRPLVERGPVEFAMDKG